MKKLLVSLLLSVIIIAPCFAHTVELIPKVGYLFSPETTIYCTRGSNLTYSDESAISVALDLYFDMETDLFVGFGLAWADKTKIVEEQDVKVGYTNFYIQVKYKFLLNSNRKDPFFVYPFAQLGFALPSYSCDLPNTFERYDILVGLYWGVGVGLEYKNIILECLYSCNYSSRDVVENSVKYNDNITYTSLRINLGYKFSL